MPAVTENVADVAPFGTVTEEGMLAADGLELPSITTAPPLGAAEVRTTVAVADWPLISEAVLRVSLLGVTVWDGGVTVTLNVALTP